MSITQYRAFFRYMSFDVRCQQKIERRQIDISSIRQEMVSLEAQPRPGAARSVDGAGIRKMLRPSRFGRGLRGQEMFQRWRKVLLRERQNNCAPDPYLRSRGVILWTSLESSQAEDIESSLNLDRQREDAWGGSEMSYFTNVLFSIHYNNIAHYKLNV